MKRALFSSEAGQGSSPIAHSAAKTDEPVREGVVAGLEPFIDTLVVCTLTALVILSTGAHNRGPEASYPTPVTIVPVDADGDGAQDVKDGKPAWTIASDAPFPNRTQAARDVAGAWSGGEDVFVLVHADGNPNTGLDIHRMGGKVKIDEEGRPAVTWGTSNFAITPTFVDDGRSIYVDYPGPSLTGHAFDRAIPGLGKWLVTLAAWLFALSTMISWSYYGEQGMVYLFGDRGAVLMGYKVVYCLLIVVAAAGFIQTDAQLDALTALGTGVMLWANIPIMLLFGSKAMRAYHDYFGRLKRGEMSEHAAPRMKDVVEGKDVE
jgi:AGCS family alanine or glycine:cation symporter